MSVQQYSVRWKGESTVVMFVCQLMDIAVVREITVLGEYCGYVCVSTDGYCCS